MAKKFKNENGFTLIELLVVISIIGFLATAVLVAFSSARLKARDARRRADLVQIQKALELYYDNKQTYPSEDYCDSSRGSCATPCPCDGSDWSYTGVFIAKVLRDENIIMNLPIDPLNDSVYNYQYEPDCNQGVCAPSGGCCYYQLSARLEGGGSFILKGGRF
ncbi:MAG: type II secretion system protein [Patescibacteria group bacterium]|nr:type II secretion system protein [Patescibacteria group bacterium]